MGLTIVEINVFYSTFTNLFIFCHVLTLFNILKISLNVFYIYGSNRSTDLHVIWQVQLWNRMIHCVTWESLYPLGKGRFGRRTPSLNVQLQIALLTPGAEPTIIENSYCTHPLLPFLSFPLPSIFPSPPSP